MCEEIGIAQVAGASSLGVRGRALPIRQRIETALDAGREVALDFLGVSATQSFVDELVGRLVLARGEDVLDRIVFRNCTDDMKAIVQFVISDRVEQQACALH